jgi:hypothetical protein
VEHIIAKKHGGGDGIENLAFACMDCNLHKGPNLTGLDPESGEVITLFHPRRQVWSEHFVWQALLLRGLTPIGRTTIRVLDMNSTERVRFRTARS